MKSSYGTKSAMFSGLCSIPCGAADAIRQQENGKNGANDPTVACSKGSELLDESHLIMLLRIPQPHPGLRNASYLTPTQPRGLSEPPILASNSANSSRQSLS